MSWIHIDDEVRIIIWALDDEQVSGDVNATAPTPSPTASSQRRWGGP